MITDDCTVCSKHITTKQKFIKCTVCSRSVHINCTPFLQADYKNCFICNLCLVSIFPFNYLSDDTEFLNVLLNFFQDFPLFSKHNLNAACLGILNNSEILNDDLNPDSNLYNNYDIDSKYYLPANISSISELQKSPKKFTVLHLNVRSLIHKIDHLEALLNTMNIEVDIIAITETWETPINSDLINLPGYNKCSKCRTYNNKGGVALFVRDSIDFSIVKYETKTFESVIIEIKTHSKDTTIVGTIYRPPGGNLVDFNEEYESLLTKLVHKNNKSIILAGDFNINLLHHCRHSETENFLNTMYAHKMLPMIKRPTRYGDCSATLIDNIFTNILGEHHISGIILDDLSDHLPIFFVSQDQQSLINNGKKYITTVSRTINDSTITDLSQKLQDLDWSMLQDKDPDEAYNMFSDTFHHVYNEALPLQVKRFKVRSKKI